MADKSKIEWTDATANVINGCSLASPGCTNCYAMRMAGSRLKKHPTRAGLTQPSKAGPVWTGEVRFHETALRQVLAWKAPRMIFWNAHGDMFHENVPDKWIDWCFAVMAATPHHTHQVLTKRSARMKQYIIDLPKRVHEHFEGWEKFGDYYLNSIPHSTASAWPLPNVWLGVSVEDQQRANERIPDLLGTPAAVRWISAEPLLGPVDLQYPEGLFPDGPAGCCSGFECGCMGRPVEPPLIFGIDWVVAGGESGPRARPMHPDWARSLRDQCTEAGAAFNFKQWGEWAPSELCDFDCKSDALVFDTSSAIWRQAKHDGGWIGDQAMCRIGKKAAGRLLDGVEHNAFPEVR